MADLVIDNTIEAIVLPNGEELELGKNPTGNIDITQAGVTDVSEYATATVQRGALLSSIDYDVSSNIGLSVANGVAIAEIDVVSERNPVFTNGLLNEDDTMDLFVYGRKTIQLPSPNLQSKSVSITPSETAHSQTVTPDSGYDGLDEVSVSVGAISSTYVGSGITRRSSTDLTASGATVSVPSGFYASNASKAVASGTEGTPTATKSTVSNHAISVTPFVTNSAGYISGGTHSGTAVSVSASELVSGSETKTANGTYDVTNLAELVVNVSGTNKNTQVVQGTTRTNSSTLTAIGSELTVSKTGTYDIYYACLRTNTSSSYTWATRLYINGVAYGSAENTTWTNNQQNTHLTSISLNANDKLRVYGRETRGTSYYICAPMLCIVEN